MSVEESKKQSSNIVPIDPVEELIDDAKKLPKADQDRLVSKMEIYSGQFPHPDILKEFEKLSPGIAKKIFEAGLENSKKRNELDEKAMDYTQKDNRRGQWMGFILALAFVVIGFILIMNGNPYLSIAAFFAPAVGIVVPFVTKKREVTHSKSEEAKEQESED